MAKELQELRGTGISIAFDETVDGTQTAARLIRETLERFGVVWLSSPHGAQAHVWIQGGSGELRFAFVVADELAQKTLVGGECGPRELTATVMTGHSGFRR